VTARRRALLAAALVAAAAFSLYHATLLPGFDFGDTGSFQTIVGEPRLTPRDAYPLYFAVGGAFVRITRLDPARALNLASALEGALAAGLIVLVGAELSGSILAGAAAALLFAVSYTFWSQAIIAEVYALHAVFVSLTLLLLFRWQRNPSARTLATFFAVYAVGFGNHLSMVLLLPGFTAFLLMAAPGGWRAVLRPRIIAIALVCAAAGALPYAWNFAGLWSMPHPPHGLGDALRTFWFDVTKSDWRETMVMHVPSEIRADRIAMYWFDVRQQFGSVVPIVAVAGLVRLFTVDARRGTLMALLYVVNFLFAFNYNVGDTHVFYLPSHLMLALLVAVGVGRPFQGRLGGPKRPALHALTATVVIAYAGARAYHDFPALDRSNDRRPAEVLEHLTADVDDQHAILLTDLNWQIANGLSYYAKVVRPEVSHARMPDVLLYAPALVDANAAIGRDVFVTDRARDEVEAAYGPLVTTRPASNGVRKLPMEIAELPRGTRYVLCVLQPSRDLPLEPTELASAVRLLTGQHASLPQAGYVAIAGVIGAPPTTTLTADQPFRRRVQVEGVDVEIRMESWLNSDTIRRMGFGHVIANREHTLIVERGVSFVAFDARGHSIRAAYRSNIFAPLPRYVCYR
jgi:hypothetical protein